MANTKLSAISNNVSAPSATDRLYIAEDISTTPVSGYIEYDQLSKQVLSNAHLVNGYISVAVASNNLTVSIKTLAGSNPSATVPVGVRVGTAMYKLTAALSVTLNAGTNWFGNGNGLARYYFVYVGYSSGLFLGFAQLPNMITSSDYSATSTAANYIAKSSAVSPDVYVIGRFKATLGVSASYNWSIDSEPVVQTPIYHTPEMTWNSAPSAITLGTGGTSSAYYNIIGNRCFFRYQCTLGTSPSVGASTMAAPLTIDRYTETTAIVGDICCRASGGNKYFSKAFMEGTTITVSAMAVSAAYPTLTTISSSVPFTWGANDQLSIYGSMLI